MKRKVTLLVVSFVVLCLLGAGIVLAIAHFGTPEWRWGSGKNFFRFDGRAVFAEMAAEPAHSVYGSHVHVWVYRREDGSIGELIVTGHAASAVCARASAQLCETGLQLDPEEDDLLAAGTGHFLGLDLGELDVLVEEPAVREYVEKRIELEWNRLLGQSSGQLEDELSVLVREAPVRRFLRAQELEDLVESLRLLENETGLVDVEELSFSLQVATRNEVERQIRLNGLLSQDQVSVVQLRSPNGQSHAVLLPFYCISTDSTAIGDTIPHVAIELDCKDFEIPSDVLETHLEALVAETEKDALWQKEFAQDRLKDARNRREQLARALEQGWMSENELISVTHVIDWNTLRVIELPEAEQMPVGEYLRSELPAIIESAQEMVQAAERVLTEIARAAQPQGELARMNIAIVIDSFLRDWDLAFLEEAKAEAYDDWRREKRSQIWRTIDKTLEDSGVNPHVLKQENVVFDVNSVDGRVLITPYFIANGNTLVIVDKRDGVVRYVDYWALRERVVKEDLPPAIAEKLRREETCEEARRDLAAPLCEEVLHLLEAGEVQSAEYKLTQALVLDPRGTALWLVGQYQKRQLNTSQSFQAAEAIYETIGTDAAFLDAFEEGEEYLSLEMYVNAIGALKKAHNLRPNVGDPLIMLGLAYLWKEPSDEYQAELWFGKAEEVDPSFARSFTDALAQGEVIHSSKYEQLKTRIDALTPMEQREQKAIRHIRSGDEYLHTGEHVKAFWEYADALQLNGGFNKPYQRIIDIYWQLGMYRRALETASLRLNDPFFRIVIDSKPLRTANPRLSFTRLSDTYQEVHDLAVQTEPHTLVLFVNGESILECTSALESDIAHLAEFFGSLEIQNIPPIGDTIAERLLNTDVPEFPAERTWADAVFFSKTAGDLVLKALVYGGIAPEFISALDISPFTSWSRQTTSLLGTRLDKIWEARNIVERIDYPVSSEETAAVCDDIVHFYSIQGRTVTSVEISSEAEIISTYAPKPGWKRLWERLAGRESLPEPHTTMTIPCGLSAEFLAKLIDGTVLQGLPEGAQSALKTAQEMVDELTHAVQPLGDVLIQLKGVDRVRELFDGTFLAHHQTAGWLRIGAGDLVPDAILRAGAWDRQDVVGLSFLAEVEAQCWELLADGMDPEAIPMELKADEYEALLETVVIPYLKWAAVPHTLSKDGLQIPLSSAESEPWFLKVPLDPVHRMLVWSALSETKNPIIWVADGSTVEQARAAWESSYLPLNRPTKIYLSAGTDASDSVRETWAANTAQLQSYANRHGMTLEFVDLSTCTSDEASERIRRAVEEGTQNVLVFAHRLDWISLDTGSGGSLNIDWLDTVGYASTDRIVALVGCNSLLFGLNDPLISRGVVDFSLTTGETLAPSELFRQLDELVVEMRTRLEAGEDSLPLPVLFEKLDDFDGIALEWLRRSYS